MKMNKTFIFNILALVTSICFVTGSARAEDLCKKELGGTVVGYFNGLSNDYSDAVYSLNYLRGTLGKEYNREKLNYELFFNASDWFDLIELYQMRNGENNLYWEGFWAREAVNSRDLLERSNAFAQERAKAEMSYYEHYMTHASTLSDLADHRLKLERYILAGYKLLLVGHSAGNLFVNSAYDVASLFMARLYDGNPSASIKVINVAPASKMLRGPYLLSDADHAIKYMPGSTPAPNLYVPDVDNGFWHWCRLPYDSGHGFTTTYLNPYLLYQCLRPRSYDLPYTFFIRLAYSALNTMERPRRVVTEGFFGITMRWEGRGDLDLIVEEPDGRVVNYMNKEGRSGRLDRDSRNGPAEEHYYAKCDSNYTKGVYKVYVKFYPNFNSTGPSPTGSRRARVEISSFDRRFNYISRELNEELANDGRIHVADIEVKYSKRSHRYYLKLR